MFREAPLAEKAEAVNDVVASTSQLLADFSLDNHRASDHSSTDSVVTPVGWAGGLLEQPRPRPERSSADLRWSNRRSPTAGSSPGENGPSSRSRGKPSSRPGYRRLWNQVTSGHGGNLGPDSSGDLTVEDLVALVQKLPGDVPVVPAVSEGLWTLDSRALAALLKELNKAGLTQRAFELFDWLRELPSSHELYALCDVFTYTTVIALCGQRQALRKSLSLMAEMRTRNISANVHTYSALMNVCIKCGELDLALDVFNQLQVEGCRANVVTFNTLIDVYGKLGRWQDAVGVLSMMNLQGLQPETRTFNTIIIACNMCGQPHEALQVYARMTVLGYTPTSTTFTALISAYGKAGQLDSALSTFEQMIARGCERNVITYSALISACEKAGRWQLALSLLDEMHRDKVSPNTVTFNSLISACAQGAQGARADALFRTMRAQRCKPDIVTFAALISAHERCADWRSALQAFEDMQVSGCRLDGTVYSTLINALWSSGVSGPCAKALALHDTAVSNGLFSMAAHVSSADGELEVALSPSTPSVALLALHRWMSDARQQLDQKQDDSFLGRTVSIILGRAGKSSRDAPPMAVIHNAVSLVLSGWRSPFSAESGGSAARFSASSAAVAIWLHSPAFAAGSRTISEAGINTPLPTLTQLVAWEAAAEASAAASFASLNVLEARQFGGGDHAVHEALALMDRCVAAGLAFCQDTAQLLVTTCFLLGSQQQGRAMLMEALEQRTSLPSNSLQGASELVQTAVRGDLAVVTPLHYLDVMLATLTGALGSAKQHHIGSALGVGPAALATAALGQSQAMFLRPCIVAAAALVVHRTQHGILPAWPLTLAKLTGIQVPGAPDFDAAVALISLAAAESQHQGIKQRPHAQVHRPSSPRITSAVVGLGRSA
ncbi:hypothetical protein WJX73_003023 [Symbiochloris irregularis]|uniref:Pentatricopeptide repeat-containing protein n=1 Tax=Symbiochloris irregularis TaxID=706552 RepID=A0AAW1NVW5_9CHLO